MPEGAPEPFEIADAPVPLLSTVRAAAGLQLPARYRTDLWDRRFRALLATILEPGCAVLDLGGGARPTISAGFRPAPLSYVGLDIDASELEKAPSGSYDETHVARGEELVPALVGRFDVVLSFFVLEHVVSTEATIANMRRYLKPGGWLLAQLAGRNSPFAFINRIVSSDLTKRMLARGTDREPETVFPANYDGCTYTDLTLILSSGWHDVEVMPLFTAARYVLFSRLLTASYVLYEDWAYRRERRDLAPYYFVAARRS